MDSTSTLQARLTPAARQKYPTYPAHIHKARALQLRPLSNFWEQA